MALFLSCQNASNEEKTGNHLINETSPYLLEHAFNPVDWHPWGPETLARAKNEQKPLLISIGYAACHWCHVMERESFENDSIAEFMNEHFICIKVDREERPDIDKIYLDAAQLISGNAGWPLHAFALPSGEPFFAGTYFPPQQWMRLIKQLNELYHEDKARVYTTAMDVAKGIQSLDLIPEDSAQTEFSKELYRDVYQKYRADWDVQKGGFKGTQKFPLTSNLELLIQYVQLTADTTEKEKFLLTLDQMASGGLFDHLGGGFARYSTDPDWRVPHFEKMLYDNGLLMSLYSKAFRWTGDPQYKEVLEKTRAFLVRELLDESGGFYASINADSEGEEGKFYVWTYQELENALSESELLLLKQFYDISNEGNWEGQIVLQKTQAGSLNSEIKKVLEKLRVHRDEKKIRPTTDDKILASWNALMTKGLLDNYIATGDSLSLSLAENNTSFFENSLKDKDGIIYRSYKDGKWSSEGFLDDYAHWIETYLKWYETTLNVEWLDKATTLTKTVSEKFSAEDSPFFYYSPKNKSELIVRKTETLDNVIPSSNATMALCLFQLGSLLDDENWKNMSIDMIRTLSPELIENGRYYSKWHQLLGWLAYAHYEIAIVGQEAPSKALAFQKNYMVNSFILGSKEESDLPLLKDKYQEGFTMIYVCQDKLCKMPKESVTEAYELIEF
jgi:uncharacterized protein YyaL (SSP411 family)